MTEITGGHLVAKHMKEQEHVRIVFCLSGGHIESILDGLTEYGVKTIDVRHEQAAAMMAHAWSLHNGEAGVCLVTAGPGFTNALTGIANAYLDNAPVVVLGGRHPLRDDFKGALQEMNQVDVAKPITKWCATCYDINRIPEYLGIAFRQATMGRPGPVFLELPPEILFGNTSLESVRVLSHRIHKTGVHPDASELEKAARLINGAKQPIFLGGSGVGFSGSGQSLTSLLEKSGMPFALLNNGRGVIPDTHPQCINDGGFTGLGTGLPQADVVVAAGIRFNWVLQAAKLSRDAQVVRIDSDPTEIDRNQRAAAGLVGDCDDVFSRLLVLLETRDHAEWIKRLRNAYEAFMFTEREQRRTASHPIHPNRLVARIMEAFGQDAYYVVDGGDTAYFGLAGLSSQHRAGVIVSSGSLLGCLGTGIPFAIAAKLSHPDKPVIVLNGDGSFGFNSMEFDTCVRHGIPIICIVNNDGAWGMIKHSQEISMGEDHATTAANLGVRNYEKMVEGLGGYGELVEHDEDIIPAIHRAIASGKPACINVMTDPTVTSPATVIFSQGFADL